MTKIHDPTVRAGRLLGARERSTAVGLDQSEAREHFKFEASPVQQQAAAAATAAARLPQLVNPARAGRSPVSPRSFGGGCLKKARLFRKEDNSLFICISLSFSSRTRNLNSRDVLRLTLAYVTQRLTKTQR